MSTHNDRPESDSASPLRIKVYGIRFLNTEPFATVRIGDSIIEDIPFAFDGQAKIVLYLPRVVPQDADLSSLVQGTLAVAITGAWQNFEEAWQLLCEHLERTRK